MTDPSVKAIIDIGGQDVKGIAVDTDGTVLDFAMNDKCAAGTGRFFESMANAFEMSLEEFSNLSLTAKNVIPITAQCAVFAESDDLPALIVDKYGEYLSVQLLSLGVAQRKDMIVECLKEVFNPKGIYERSDVAVRKKEGLEECKGVLYGEVPDEIIIEENGLKMTVDIKNGQKTGYFLDQKENRNAIRRYAKDKTVLDCFCNSGGFSMNAATVAKSVIAADISPLALEEKKKNAILNGFNNVETMQCDVFEALRNFNKQGKKFGLVILDPPAFCKSASEVKDATKGYTDINILGMKIVEKGGYLVTSSCSHYMTRVLFENMLMTAAKESGRRVKCLEIKTQSPDHPSLLTAE
ncbi:MAG: class I SAM-dependent methyltransferase, partial [Clostridia bacterium]|nr:class I SAM-dependent methyltransferase [Clostridia bacterium]